MLPPKKLLAWCLLHVKELPYSIKVLTFANSPYFSWFVITVIVTRLSEGVPLPISLFLMKYSWLNEEKKRLILSSIVSLTAMQISGWPGQLIATLFKNIVSSSIEQLIISLIIAGPDFYCRPCIEGSEQRKLAIASDMIAMDQYHLILIREIITDIWCELCDPILYFNANIIKTLTQ